MRQAARDVFDARVDAALDLVRVGEVQIRDHEVGSGGEQERMSRIVEVHPRPFGAREVEVKLRPLSAERQAAGNLRRDGEFREAGSVCCSGGVAIGEEDGGAIRIRSDRTLACAEAECDLVIVADAVVTFDAFQRGGRCRQRAGENPIRIVGSDRVMAARFDDDRDPGRSLGNRLRVKRGDRQEKQRRGERTKHTHKRTQRGLEPDDRAGHWRNWFWDRRDCKG